MNDTRFEHTSRYGTRFLSDYADFRKGVTIQRPPNLLEEGFVADVAEMVGFHATNILPMLNGFQGYDSIHYRVVQRRGGPSEI